MSSLSEVASLSGLAAGFNVAILSRISGDRAVAIAIMRRSRARTTCTTLECYVHAGILTLRRMITVRHRPIGPSTSSRAAVGALTPDNRSLLRAFNTALVAHSKPKFVRRCFV